MDSTPEEQVWDRIQRHAGEKFFTKTGRVFTYRVPGNFLRVERDATGINRSLSRTNFVKAMASMPADGPGEIKDRQGSAYTWAILMDERIRRGFW